METQEPKVRASGVVASREYEEMTVPNLEAFGRGVREVLRK